MTPCRAAGCMVVGLDIQPTAIAFHMWNYGKIKQRYGHSRHYASLGHQHRLTRRNLNSRSLSADRAHKVPTRGPLALGTSNTTPLVLHYVVNSTLVTDPTVVASTLMHMPSICPMPKGNCIRGSPRVPTLWISSSVGCMTTFRNIRLQEETPCRMNLPCPQ
jgi:hypothetical protein